MIFYHLDRLNTFPIETNKQLLQPNGTQNTDAANLLFQSLFQNGISKQGERYLNPFDEKLGNYKDAKDTYNNCKIYTVEYVFEIVRMIHFPDCPSRFTSLFACQTKRDVKLWYDLLRGNKMNFSKTTIKKIETTGKTFICDSYWRDYSLDLKDKNGNVLSPVFSPFAYHEFAKNYWSGKQTNTPRMEVLCELPVTVIESVPISDYLNGNTH